LDAKKGTTFKVSRKNLAVTLGQAPSLKRRLCMAPVSSKTHHAMDSGLSERND